MVSVAFNGSSNTAAIWNAACEFIDPVYYIFSEPIVILISGDQCDFLS